MVLLSAIGSLRKVLVAEDDAGVRELLAEMISRLGFEVVQAVNGLQALDLFLKQEFDLVVTDLCMPGMDGKALARHIKQTSPSVPIILITGSPLPETRKVVKDGDVDKLILKPFNFRTLEESVRSLLRQEKRWKEMNK